MEPGSRSKKPLAYLVSVCFKIDSDFDKIVVDESIYWIEAENFRDAYDKARGLAKAYEAAGDQAFSNSAEYLGVSEIMPVYDFPNHGAELGWRKLYFNNMEDAVSRVIDEVDL